MFKKVSRDDVLQKIEVGQFVYGVCCKRDDKGVFFQTGIPGFYVWQPSRICKAVQGETSWFVVTDVVDRDSGKIMYQQVFNKKESADNLKALKPGNLYLGYILNPKMDPVRVQLTPRLFATVNNFKDAYDRYMPIPGDLCCVKLLTVSPTKITGELVGTQRYEANEREGVSWNSFDDKALSSMPESLQPKEIDIDFKMLQRFAERFEMSFDETSFKKTSEIARGMIADAYNTAVQRGELIIDQFYKKQTDRCIHTSFCIKKGKSQVNSLPSPPIFAGLRPSSKEKDHWFVEFIGAKSTSVKKIFSSQVSVADPVAMIQELADIALPEKWSYGEDPNAPNKILESYFYFTYYYVWSCNQLVTSKEGNLRIFNTGLVNYNYSPIYCVMQKANSIEQNLKKEWVFEGFAVSGECALGKKITTWILNADLPPRPNYINELSDLFFDTKKQINMDYMHMIVDNIDRLPLDIYNSLSRTSYNIIEPVISQIRKGGSKSHEQYQQLKNLIEENSEKLLRPLVRIFEEAVSNAVSRVTWNYKTAVPIFYPARFIISLLLPLELTDSSKETHMPDVALVVSRQPSGNYQGETILTLEMAYNDSRIITRPDSDWLVSGKITSEDDTDDWDKQSQ